MLTNNADFMSKLDGHIIPRFCLHCQTQIWRRPEGYEWEDSDAMTYCDLGTKNLHRPKPLSVSAINAKS
jgi:hypothetical protein